MCFQRILDKRALELSCDLIQHIPHLLLRSSALLRHLGSIPRGGQGSIHHINVLVDARHHLCNTRLEGRPLVFGQIACLGSILLQNLHTFTQCGSDGRDFLDKNILAFLNEFHTIVLLLLHSLSLFPCSASDLSVVAFDCGGIRRIDERIDDHESVLEDSGARAHGGIGSMGCVEFDNCGFVLVDLQVME